MGICIVGIDEHTLEYLLAFHGRIHYLEQGFWLKFEIRADARASPRPALHLHAARS